ncbi:Meiosis regulator and mRNA stability factor 1-like protein [Drosera capensis]
MNSLTPKSKTLTLIHIISPYPLFLLSRSSPISSLAASPPHHGGEAASRNVRVSVWWDFENCGVPVGVNVYRVAQSITAAVRANGIKGPVQITAFGDVLQLSRANQVALSVTGVNLTHIPGGDKNGADRSLLVDLMHWVSQNPPPAHLFLISGDKAFASTLHRLRMNNYNILLASTGSSPNVLCSAASIMWSWKELAKGENLTGRHFNQPPDGPFYSWYGQFKVPLEDPFSVSHTNAEPLESKSSVSKGSSVSARKLNGKVDSVSNVVNQNPPLVNKQVASPGSMIKDRVQEAKTSTTNGSDLFAHKVAGKNESITSSLEVNEKVLEVKEDLSAQVKHSDVEQGQDAPSEKLSKNEMLNDKVLENNTTVAGLGFFDRAWAWFSWGSDDDRHIQLSNTLDQSHAFRGGFDELSPKDTELTGNAADSAHDSRSLGKAECSPDAKHNVGTEREGSETISQDRVNESNASSSFVAKVIGWCMFWKGEPNVGAMSEQSSAELKIVDVPEKHEVFFTDSQWRDAESFIKSSDASQIILNSRNREDLAQAMQKGGPKALQSLCLFDLLHLVDLVISEKKWIEECPLKTHPFRVIQPNDKGAIPAHASNANGLSSIFMSSSSPSNSTKRSGHHVKRIVENLQHSEASSTINKKPAKKSRTEILADCWKLSQELLNSNPEGFSIRIFRKLFIERYGYALDHEKLGYPKLRSLLQIIPGLQIVSTSVSPATWPGKDLSAQQSGIKGQTINPILDASLKDDDNESWEELGPVEIPKCSNEEAKGACKVDDDYESALSCKVDDDYESALSNDDLTESEEETFPSSKGEAQEKYRMNEDKSSLLQVLDAWHSNKDNSSMGDGPDNLEDTVGISGQDSRPSGLSQAGARQGEFKNTASLSYTMRQRPAKSYNFISDSAGDEDDKLIDVIQLSMAVLWPGVLKVVTKFFAKNL